MKVVSESLSQLHSSTSSATTTTTTTVPINNQVQIPTPAPAPTLSRSSAILHHSLQHSPTPTSTVNIPSSVISTVNDNNTSLDKVQLALLTLKLKQKEKEKNRIVAFGASTPTNRSQPTVGEDPGSASILTPSTNRSPLQSNRIRQADSVVKHRTSNIVAQSSMRTPPLTTKTAAPLTAAAAAPAADRGTGLQSATALSSASQTGQKWRSKSRGYVWNGGTSSSNQSNGLKSTGAQQKRGTASGSGHGAPGGLTH